MRHTFALAGGSLPVLAKILGLSLLMRYVYPSQADMDRAMEWYSKMQASGSELEKMPMADLGNGGSREHPGQYS
jgi:hypothetical protein